MERKRYTTGKDVRREEANGRERCTAEKRVHDKERRTARKLVCDRERHARVYNRER